MRTGFKVATAFTGAAACAAVFTPGATAVAATTARTQVLEPDAFHINCTGGSTTSLHFYYPASADHGPICVGEHGTTSLNGTYYASFCAGNNDGVYFSTPLIDSLDQNYFGVYWHHETARVRKHVYDVAISMFSGNDKCPF